MIGEQFDEDKGTIITLLDKNTSQTCTDTLMRPRINYLDTISSTSV